MSEGFNGGAGASLREYTAAGAGVALYVKEMGEGPAVVVLHGGPGAHHDYLIPGFDLLADQFRLFFYDQRGGGRSRVTRPKEVTWRDHVADLEALRSTWGLESMTVLGYSWGGLLALLYATQHPDRVRCLALVDPAAGWGDYQKRFKAEFDARMASDVVAALYDELERSGLRDEDPDAYRLRRFELSIAGYFKDPREAHDVTPFRVQGQVQTATWSSLAGHSEKLREKVAELSTQTLILHGRHDPIPVSWAEELSQTLPAARLAIMENSGHVPYVEEPEATMAALRPFLEGCGS